MKYLGDFPTGATIYIPFATYDKDDGSSITMTGLAVTDIEIYKNGSAIQRASDAGYTLLDTDGIDFDTITGIHGFSVDTSDNTDAGFYAAGSEYWVVVSSVTVDAVVVNFIAATFSIERNGGALALLKNATYGLSALETLVDDLESRLGTPVGASISADVAGIQSDTNDIQTRLPAALVSGRMDSSVGSNLDKTGYSIGVGGIAATAFAAGAIDAAALAVDATTEITAGIRIKKNTALNNFMFLMVDSTDHVTPKTGLTITSTRSIDGAAFAACANAASEVANGIYKINFAATDLNGDVIAFKFAGGATSDDRLITIVTTT